MTQVDLFNKPVAKEICWKLSLITKNMSINIKQLSNKLQANEYQIEGTFSIESLLIMIFYGDE